MEEKRVFKRYKKGSEFDLKTEGGALKAELTDYSMGGLGAVVKDSPSVKKGDVIGIQINEPNINDRGEIIWSRQSSSGFRVGIKIVGRIKGLLKDFSLADILIGLQRTLKTGILTVDSGTVEKKIYIKKGDMIFSSSNRDEERLGDILLRDGIITKEQYDLSVVEMKKSGERQGGVLVKLGYLNPRFLATAVKNQVEEIILSLFALPEGSFVFDEMPLPTDEVITLKLSAAHLIYTGIKRMKEMELIDRDFPSLDSVLRFSADPLDLFQDVRLDASGKKIVSCIDGRTSIRETLSISQLERSDALKTIYALLTIRIIEGKGPGDPFVEVPVDVVEEIFDNSASGTNEMKREIDPEIKDMIEKMHCSCDSLGYYDLLGIKASADLSEIKSAYYKAAKRFHPDMHFHVADDSLKDKLSDIFSYIYEAYATLSTTEKRREYDKSMSLRPAKLTSNQDRARALFGEGKAELKKEGFQDAELLFGQAAYFDNTISDYHYYYGISLIKNGKFKLAEKALERALRLEPSNTTYMAELGFAFLKLGFPARAKAFFEKALKISPNNARASEGLMNLRK